MKVKINIKRIPVKINYKKFFIIRDIFSDIIYWCSTHKYFLYLILTLFLIFKCYTHGNKVKLIPKTYKCEVIDRSEYNNNKYLILQETTNNRIFKLNVTDSAYYLSYKNKYLYFNLLDNEIDPDIINPADNYVVIIVLLFMLLLVFTVIKIADIF